MKQIHHHTLIEASEQKIDWWNTEIQSKNRCPICWLRCHDCFCSLINQQRKCYNEFWQKLFEENGISIEILIYYHPHELGRSANTAHVFEALNETACSSLVLGNEQEEMLFWTKGIQECHDKTVFTCVLYPGKASIPMSEWIEKVKLENGPKANTDPQTRKLEQGFRLIVLDGTYPCASRIAKYLEVCQKEYRLSKPFFQFVSLELETDENLGYCRSAVAGIMYQPAKEKICSYQATAIAIKDILIQLSYNKQDLMAFFSMMMEDLQNWIKHIIQKKIKFGKLTTMKCLRDIDNAVPDYVQEIIVSISFFFYF